MPSPATPAFAMAMLAWPVVRAAPAPVPRARLLVPVVRSLPASKPTPTFPVPLVKLIRALTPSAVFRLPVEVPMAPHIAPLPTAVLLEPVR